MGAILPAAVLATISFIIDIAMTAEIKKHIKHQDDGLTGSIGNAVRLTVHFALNVNDGLIARSTRFGWF